MRTLSFFFSLLVGGVAVACPNLTGTYNCMELEDRPRTYNMTVTQTNSDGVTTYFFSGNGQEIDLIADGKTRESHWNTNGILGTDKKTAICTGSKLQFNFYHVWVTEATMKKRSEAVIDTDIEPFARGYTIKREYAQWAADGSNHSASYSEDVCILK